MIFALNCALSLHAQSNFYALDLSADTLSGQWAYKTTSVEGQDSLIIHLPLQAYLDKESFLNEQLREFQDPDLHFASQEDLAYFSIKTLSLNGEPQKLPANINSEFLKLAAPEVEDLKIELSFNFQLPAQSFTGNGQSENEMRIIDLLPRFYKDPTKAHPLSYYYDTDYSREFFKLQLKIPAGKALISNLSKQVFREQEILISGYSRQLQLFIRPQFTAYTLDQGGTLFLPEADDNFYRNFKLALDEAGQYFHSELNDSLKAGLSYVFLDDKKGEYQSAELVSIERPKNWLDLRFDLVQAMAEGQFRYRSKTNGWEQPWLARGLPYYYKYHFIKSRYPQKRWIPFQSPILNGLFGFDAFDFAYQNRFLFLFLQRQGLDQALSAPADSLSRLNYEAIVQAKAFLLLSHLRAYTGERDFRRAMAKALEQSESQNTEVALEQAFNYYSPKNLDWFFQKALFSAEIYDYQLKDFDHCPTVSTATVVNTGHHALPYSLTGYKEGKPILTQWYEGHTGKRTVQLFHEDYDKVVINAHLIHAEYRQKNNTYYNRWILPRMEPLSFQLYNSFEAAEATQVFYVPSLYYNAYDKFLLGINLSNRSILVQKPFEYTLVPEFSTGTNKLTGTASATYNWTTPKSHFFRQISLGLYTRYNHYDRDLAYYRISPSLNLRIRKKYPRSPYIQSLRLRGVILNREINTNNDIVDNQIETASYTVLNANYRLEYTSLLRPTIFRFHLETAQKFTKIFAEYDQRWMLPNKKWLILRAFAGGFLRNQLADEGFKDNFYSLGLSGTPDYLFDYYFIGRSDDSGIWSRQFFTSDGGFKSETQAYADDFLLSTNLSLPFYGPVGAFADFAISEEGQYWDYGIRLALLTDFLEFYFPLQNQDRNFYQEANYLGNTRFVLDLKLGNIINRLRRGFY